MKLLIITEKNKNLTPYELYDYILPDSADEISNLLNSDKFDIIVMDLMDSSESLKLLSGGMLLKNIPVIFITAAGNEADAVRAIKAGATDYLIRDAAGNYIQLLPVVIEKALSERAKNNQVNILTKAVELSPSIAAITDLNGNLEYVNPKFCEITGYHPDEVIGKNPRVLNSGTLPKSVYRELWKNINSGNLSF